MKKGLIIALAAIVLVGGGAGGYLTYQRRLIRVMHRKRLINWLKTLMQQKMVMNFLSQMKTEKSQDVLFFHWMQKFWCPYL